MVNVLVVDDEPDIRALLRIVLEREDYTVQEAGNGADALDICMSTLPDLVITDLLMPKMSGTEFLESLLEHDSKVKVIAITGGSLGHDPTSETSKAQELGVDGVVVKPFDPAKVVTMCKAVLNRS